MKKIFSLLKSFKFLWPALVLITIGYAIYANTLNNAFQFDDRDFILHNTHIRNITDVKAVWTALAHPSRFVTFYSFALNYHFHQYDVFGYHVVNIVIHIINALLILWFCRMLFNLPINKRKEENQTYPFIVVLTVALIFITHPLQTQAVTYITQRFTSLATMFYLLTMCLYTKGRFASSQRNSMMYFATAIISALLGMFSKQIVFTLPFAILLTEYLLIQPSLKKDSTSEKSKQKPKVWVFYLILGLFCLIVPSFFHFDLKAIFGMTTESGSHEHDIITAPHYFMTQFRVICTYLRLLIVPIGQNLDHDFALSKHFFEPKTLLCFLGLVALLLTAIRIHKKNRLMAFGIFWFFLTLSVESSIIPIHHVIFEHRVYLPSLGFCLVVAIGLWHLVRHPKIYTVTVSIITLTLCILTVQRNQVWKSEIAMWEDVSKKSPNKSKPFNNLGTVYFEKKQYDKALHALNRAIEIRPDYGAAYNNRGATYMEQGLYDFALRDFNRALSLQGPNSDIFSNRGDLYKRAREFDLALQDLNQAIELNPNNIKAYDNRGIIYGEQGQYQAALMNFNKAIELNKKYAKGYNNRGVIYLRQGRFDEALYDFNKAITLDPKNPDAYSNRGNVHQHYNQFQDALADYNQALSLKPNFLQVYNNKGVTLGKMGAYEEALQIFQQALQYNANYVEVYNNIGLIYKRTERYTEALTYFSKAIEMSGQGSAHAYFNRSLIHQLQSRLPQALEDAQMAQQLGYPTPKQYLQKLQNEIILTNAVTHQMEQNHFQTTE